MRGIQSLKVLKFWGIKMLTEIIFLSKPIKYSLKNLNYFNVCNCTISCCRTLLDIRKSFLLFYEYSMNLNLKFQTVHHVKTLIVTTCFTVYCNVWLVKRSWKFFFCYAICSFKNVNYHYTTVKGAKASVHSKKLTKEPNWLLQSITFIIRLMHSII